MVVRAGGRASAISLHSEGPIAEASVQGPPRRGLFMELSARGSLYGSGESWGSIPGREGPREIKEGQERSN